MSPSNHLFTCSVLHLLSFIAAIKTVPPYKPTDIILLTCGASSSSTSLDGRYWDGDAHSKFLPFNSDTFSIASTATQQNPSIPQVPYTTARIFNSTFTYIFPVPPGPKFVRLYFNPAANYSNFTPSESFFSIKANHYTLLNNFSAFFAISTIHPRVDYVIKEFIVAVGENQTLNITINPSPKSTAFINGIEIVPMPDRLYAGGDGIPVKLIGTNQFVHLDNSYAFETVYRINVGGASIDGILDTGMFRNWLQDSDYIYGKVAGLVSKSPDNVSIKYTSNTPAFVAPELVYRTMRSMGSSNAMVNLNYNLTWTFSVDGGFTYLVRLHFCETRLEIQNVGDEIFSIFINNQTAEDKTDIIYLSGGNSVPVYKDYVVWVPDGSLWLALHPKNTTYTIINDAILNGLEILKLSNSTGSLAGSNPPPIGVPSPNLIEKTKSKLGLTKVIIVVGPVLFGILALSLVTFFFMRKQRVQVSGPYKSSSTAATALLLPTDLCRRFTMPEIRTATMNFHDENVVGSGGFGMVYKGFIENGSVPVAIKRLISSSKQGVREFHTEIEMLSKLRHTHLVSLIGYCDDEDEMILVYEFMDQGNLQDHIYKAQKIPLMWEQRLQICIGAAKGLHYLHTGVKHTIIHRDVKSSNILLDSNWVAKVSDFGLSKIGPTSESQTHVSTVVRGTVGYLDPEYYRRQQLTEKSDVYSFGVVLLEVVYARPPIFSTLTKERVNLVEWARKCYKEGSVDQNIDSLLKGCVATVSLNKFMEIAESCIREKDVERPTMEDVLWGLEFALQLQETTKKKVDDTDDINDERERRAFAAMIMAGPENVFSEVMNQDGR